jgi:PAS domain-containing protein
LGTVWVTIQLDISARKRAEAELQQSEQRLNLVLEATGNGAWDWNIQTGDVYFSRFWISSLGYSSQEVAPRVTSWESMVHPDDMPRVARARRSFRWSHGYIRMCAAPAEKDGSWRWNLDRGRVVERSPAGEPLRMVGTDSDLSEQRWSGLREFTPICAGCKSIRNEDGSWQALERHFNERSLARFSHGLCPDCVRKFSEGLVD